jgi:hypothetical protein
MRDALSRRRDVLTVKSETGILHGKLPNPSGRLRPLVILCCVRESHCASPFSQKRLSPSGPKRELALIPMGSPKEKVVPTGAQPTVVLACFPLRLHLGHGLMQPHERLFSFPFELPVSLSLSRDKLNVCCMVLLTELGLSILQDMADILRTCSGDRRRGMSSRTACRCVRSHMRATC